MASEILKSDQNNERVIGLVTDDVSQEIRMGRIDDATKGLKVTVVGGSMGTVTSITQGTGILLSPSPITTTGSVSLATSLQPMATLAGNSLKVLRVNAGETAVEYATVSSGLTVGSTVISGGATTQILYDNAGVLGEYTITGTGTVVAMATNPTFSGITFTDATNVVLNATTGTKIGTATTQKLAFYNSTPIVQPTGDVVTALQNLGLVASATIASATNINTATESTDTTCFPVFVTASGTQTLPAKTNTTLTYNSNTNDLGVTKLNGLTITASTGTFTLTNAKTFAVTSSLTLSGTDSTTMTFPTTTATIARTDAGQTFTGVNNFTSPDITTSLTTSTVSFTAFAGATTLLTIGGTGASASLFAPSTLDTSSSVTGAIRTSGGISAAKSANIGTTLTVGTGYQIGGAAASGKILIGNGTNFVASTPTYPNAAGTTGNVLTSDGTNFVSSAPTGSSAPRFVFATLFETSARFNQDVSGGTITFGSANGPAVTTTATATRYANLNSSVIQSVNAYDGSPTVSFSLELTTKGTTGQYFFGINTGINPNGTAFDYTQAHIGFKIEVVASVASLFATQGAGAAETASSALTTIAAADTLELSFKVNGSSSVDYYWRKNGSTLSAATNQTTNLPTGGGGSALFNMMVNNKATATTQTFTAYSGSYSR